MAAPPTVQSGLSVGNALGSNITNIALILGLTAAVHPAARAKQVDNPRNSPAAAGDAGRLFFAGAMASLVLLMAAYYWAGF